MTTRRNQAAADLTEGESAEAPGTIPEGVDADVTVKYRRRVTPPAASDEDLLSQLAAEEAPNLDDPLTAWLSEWFNYAGYNCEIIRLPDPASRRMPGNAYARPCFELERLGGIPFDPVNFIPTLQHINGYSGGVFRVFLTDGNGQIIPDARLDRLAIADPPSSGAGNRVHQPGFMAANANQASYAQPAPLPSKPAEPSEFEKTMQDLQRKLLQSALDRAINPPPPPPPVAAQLPDEDRLALMLFKQGELLGPVIQKVVNAVQAPDAATQSTWKDKAFEYVMANPQVGNQIAGMADRLVAALANLLPGNAPTAPPPPRPATQHAPASTPGAQAQAAAGSGFKTPESPQPEPIDADDESEDEDMAILDDMLALLTGTDPIVAGAPVFVELQRNHPVKFRLYVGMIAQGTMTQITDFVKSQSPLYQSLLESPVTGPHILTRLEQLQTLCKQATQPAPAPPPAPTEEHSEIVQDAEPSI